MRPCTGGLVSPAKVCTVSGGSQASKSANRRTSSSLMNRGAGNTLACIPPHLVSRVSPMPCSRGQANPDRNTTLRLFADSGGYCQRPECASRLFVDTGTKNVHIAEMAHIIAASDDGPRADAKASAAEKGSYDNLILLCANCHTSIDKAPEDFPTR